MLHQGQGHQNDHEYDHEYTFIVHAKFECIAEIFSEILLSKYKLRKPSLGPKIKNWLRSPKIGDWLSRDDHIIQPHRHVDMIMNRQWSCQAWELAERKNSEN